VAMTLIPQHDFLMIAFKEFSVLAWNVRGFANKKSCNHMHDVVSKYKPDVIFLNLKLILFSLLLSNSGIGRVMRRSKFKRLKDIPGGFGPSSVEAVASLSLWLIKCISVLILLLLKVMINGCVPGFMLAPFLL
jgi:hypothetical protein